MTGRRALAIVAIPALAALILTADALQLSTTRLYPNYDEISYLALGRQFAREGGFGATVRCYLEARCREDNRPPLYPMLLAPAVDDAPASFVRAKVVNFGTMLLLLAAVLLAVRGLFPRPVVLATFVLLCLMPVVPEFAVRLMHDPLYAAMTVAAVYAAGRWQERGAVHWLVVGAFVGLAFLSKGSGHLLLLSIGAVSFYRHRAALVRRPILYAGAAGFLAVAFFLIWRNLAVWREPFYNVNAGEVWLEQWRDVFVSRMSPEHAQLGLRWYLAHHSVGALLLKLVKGAGHVAGVFFYTAGVGPSHPVARVVTGVAVLALAGLGLRRAWRGGLRVPVMAVLCTLLVYCAALTLAATGAPGAQVRFAFPYVVLLIPFAAYELVENVGLRLQAWLSTRWPMIPARRFLLPAIGVALAARLAFALPGARVDAGSHYRVEPRWNETSTWLSRALAPGERFAIPYHSRYSTWDLPRPDVDPRWGFWFGVSAADLLRYMRALNIHKVLIDTADVDFAQYADKLGAEKDAHGPLAFLGWPRCFADSDTPSRFLAYCQQAP